MEFPSYNGRGFLALLGYPGTKTRLIGPITITQAWLNCCEDVGEGSLARGILIKAETMEEAAIKAESIERRIQQSGSV